MVAALSPNTRWDTNLIDADSVLGMALAPYELADYNECTVSTYTPNKAKAFAICELTWSIERSGERRHPAGYMRDVSDPLDILRGPKVTAFYLNLIGDSSALTLDSHAYNAFCGFRATGSDLPGQSCC